VLFLHLLVHHFGGSLRCFATSLLCCWNYCCRFIALLVLMLLFRCIVGLVVVCLLHYWSWCWFITLLVQLLHHVTIHAIGSQIPFESPCCSFALLFCVVGCYSCCMCFGEVLPPSPLTCKWRAHGPLCCCMPPTTRYTPLSFTPLLVLLLICHMIGVIIDFFCWLAMVRYYPFPLPCACGEVLLWLERKEK
jgi:hypothetical protein